MRKMGKWENGESVCLKKVCSAAYVNISMKCVDDSSFDKRGTTLTLVVAAVGPTDAGLGCDVERLVRFPLYYCSTYLMPIYISLLIYKQLHIPSISLSRILRSPWPLPHRPTLHFNTRPYIRLS
jgi:hypothetical protein